MVSSSHVGEPGQGVFVATGSRGDILGTAWLRAAGGPRTPGLGRPTECTLRQGAALVWPGVKGAHSALREPPPEGEPRGLTQWLGKGHSVIASGCGLFC